ncbi:MAG: hypothetical protein HY720_25745 [Planctomycetes bacterium]|nr:hypothetical protein [Planctomycetota bacterium]
MRRCYHCKNPLLPDALECPGCHRMLDARELDRVGGAARFLSRIEAARDSGEIDRTLAEALGATSLAHIERLEAQARQAALDTPAEMVFLPDDQLAPATAAPLDIQSLGTVELAPEPAAPAPRPVEPARAVQPVPATARPVSPPAPGPVPPPVPVFPAPPVTQPPAPPPAPWVQIAPRPPVPGTPAPAASRPIAPPKPPRAAPRWLVAVRSIFFENVLWFVAGFLILAGAIYFAATTWRELAGEIRYVIVLGTLAGLGALLAGLGWLLARRFDLAREGLVCFLLANLVAPVLFVVAGQAVPGLGNENVGFAALLALVAAAFVAALALVQGTAAPVANWLWQAGLLVVVGALHAVAPALTYETTARHVPMVYGGLVILVAAYLVRTGAGEGERGRPGGLLARYFLPGVVSVAYLGLLVHTALRAFGTGYKVNPGLYSTVFLVLGALLVDREVGLLFPRKDERARVTPISILGFSLTVLALAVSTASEWSVLATTALAAAVYAGSARAFRKPFFAVLAMAAGLVAYFESPLPVREILLQFRSAASEELGYGGGRIPYAYYGITLFPYVAAVVWFARRFRGQEDRAFFRATVGWLVAVSIGLLALVNSSLSDFRPQIATLPLYGAGFFATAALLDLPWLHYLGVASFSLATWYVSRHFGWVPADQAALLGAAGIVWQGASFATRGRPAGRAFANGALALLAVSTAALAGLVLLDHESIRWYGPAATGALAMAAAFEYRQPLLAGLALALLTAAAHRATVGLTSETIEHGLFLAAWSWVFLGAAWTVEGTSTSSRGKLLREVLAVPLLLAVSVLSLATGVFWTGHVLFEGATSLAAWGLLQAAFLVLLAVPLARREEATHVALLFATIAALVLVAAIWPDRGFAFYAMALVGFDYILVAAGEGLPALKSRMLAPFARLYKAPVRRYAVGLGMVLFAYLFALVSASWVGVERAGRVLGEGWLPTGLWEMAGFLLLAPLFGYIARKRGKRQVAGALALASPLLALEGLLLYLGTALSWQAFVLALAAFSLSHLPPRRLLRLAGANLLRGAFLLRLVLAPLSLAVGLVVCARLGALPWPALAAAGFAGLSISLVLSQPVTTWFALAAFTAALDRAFVGFDFSSTRNTLHGLLLDRWAWGLLGAAWVLGRAFRTRERFLRVLARPVAGFLPVVLALGAIFWAREIPASGVSYLGAWEVFQVALVAFLGVPLWRKPEATYFAAFAANGAWAILSLAAFPGQGFFFHGLSLALFAYVLLALGRVLARTRSRALYPLPLAGYSTALGLALFAYFAALVLARPLLPELGSPIWGAASFLLLLPLYVWQAWRRRASATPDTDPARPAGTAIRWIAAYLAMASPLLSLVSLALWRETEYGWALSHAYAPLVAAWGLLWAFLPARRLAAAGGGSFPSAAPALRATLGGFALALLGYVYFFGAPAAASRFSLDLVAAILLATQAALEAVRRERAAGWADLAWLLSLAALYAHVLVRILEVPLAWRPAAMAGIVAAAAALDLLFAGRRRWEPFRRALARVCHAVLAPALAWLAAVWALSLLSLASWDLTPSWLKLYRGEHLAAVLSAAAAGLAASGVLRARRVGEIAARYYLHLFLLALAGLATPVGHLLSEDVAWEEAQLPHIDLALVAAGVVAWGLFRPDRGRERALLYHLYPALLAGAGVLATLGRLDTPVTSATLFAASFVALALSLARRRALLGYVYGALFLAGIYWLIFWLVPKEDNPPQMILPLLALATLAVGLALATVARKLAGREGLAGETAAVLGSVADWSFWLAFALAGAGALTVPAAAVDPTNFALTLAALVGLSGGLVHRYRRTTRRRHVYALGAAVLLALFYLRAKAGVLEFLAGYDGHVLVLVAIVAYQISRIPDRARHANLVGPLSHYGLFLPVLAPPLLVPGGWRATLASTTLLLFAAVHYGMIWLASRRRTFLFLAAGLLDLSLFSFWLSREIFDARFYGVPIGLTILALAEANRKDLGKRALDALRIAGFLVLYASAALPVLIDRTPSPDVAVVLGVFTILGVLVGTRLGSRTLVLLSAATLVLDVVGHLLAYGAAYGFLGAALLVLTGIVFLGLALYVTVRRRQSAG